MNKETFSQKLLVALGHSKFDLDVSAVKMLDSASWIPQALLSPVRLTNVEGAAKADQLKREFGAMSSYAPLLAFKFVLGQPLVACALDSDSLAPDDLIAAAASFYKCIKNCMPYTLKPHGTVSGILLFIFFESANADRFISTAQQRCRYSAAGTFTFVRPWAIDVSSKKVTPERKTWLYALSGFNPNKLATDLFST